MVPFYFSAPEWAYWAFYGVWFGPHALVVLMGKPKLVLIVVLLHFGLIAALVVRVLVFGAPFGAPYLQASLLLFAPVALVTGCVSYILARGAQWLYAKRKT